MKNKFNCGTTKVFFGIMAIFLMLAIASVSAVASESILTPTKDSYVSSAMPNTNYGTATQLAVRANLLYPKRALIQFANLPTVPPSYRVNSAVMRLYIEKAPWALETYNAERISSDWSETLVNWKNQPATAGISGSAKVNTTGWINIDVTDDVKGFYDGILENKGWVIKDSIEGTAIFTQEGIAKSKENGNPLLTPQLVINYCVDNDADGYFRAEEGCGPVDCNDYDASVNPGAPEKCDNIDNDCDGIIDEDVSETQSCGTDVGACEFGTRSRTCTAGTWGAWGACTGGITPAAESCDGFDNDCDGTIDENLTRAYGASDVGECEYGTETCTMGAWLITTPAVFPAPEICDNKDNDCDGLADNGVVRSCYTGIPGTGNVGICREGVETCSAGTWGACIGQILPEQEICENGIDENCNGRDEPCFGSVCAGTNIPDTVLAGSVFSASVTMRNIGEDVWTQFYAYRLGSASPNDNVVWGKSRAEMETGASVAKGQEYTFNFELTAPSEAGIFSSDWKMLQDGVRWFGETCYKNINVVYDCIDSDSDGFYGQTAACPTGDDCNDANPSVNIAASEICDGIDNNCDGTIDEGCLGNNAECVSISAPDKIIAGRKALVSVTMNNTGKNTWTKAGLYKLGSEGDSPFWGDTRALMPESASVGPGQSYTFNFNITAPATTGLYSLDRKMVLEYVEWFGEKCSKEIEIIYNCADSDSDGYFINDAVECPTGNDCDDSNPAVYPGATELCNEKDDNCDGTVDETCLPFDAECTGNTIPNEIMKGTTAQATVTMKNIGTEDWTAAGLYRLGSTGASFGTDRANIDAASTVLTGGNYTFAFSMTAPGTTGDLIASYQMVKEYVEWSGDSCSKTVKIVDMPDVNYTFTPALPDGNNGWYKTKPTIKLTVNSTYNPSAKAYYRWNTGTEQMFSADITAPEGTNTLYFYGKDSSGNIGPVYNYQFKVDSLPARISAFRPFDKSAMKNSMPEIFAHYSEMGASGIDAATSYLEIDGANVTGLSVTSMDLRYNPTTPIADGLHTVKAFIADKAGNYAIQEWSFTIDTTPLGINILSPIAMAYANSRTQQINILLEGLRTGEKALSIERSLNTGGYSQLCRYCTSYLGSMGFTEGMNTLRIRATDAVGNVNNSQVVFTIDTVAPVFRRQSPANGASIKATTTFSVTYDEGSLASAEIVSWTSIDPTKYSGALTGCPSGNYVSCSMNADVSVIPVGTKFYYYFKLTDSQGRITNTPTYTTTITA